MGDAGYYAHPAAANGIHDALRSSELLVDHVQRALAAGLEPEALLDQYHACRDAENKQAYYGSYRLGGVNPFNDPELATAVMRPDG